MNKTWLLSIFTVSFLMLAVLKTQQQRTLVPFFQAPKSLKLQHFTEAKNKLPPREQDHLELWESMLTGRTAPVARWMKEEYRALGLKHLFTPSGFHLSAILAPFLFILKSLRLQMGLLVLVGVVVFALPGLGALKRMVLVKINQRWLGSGLGFFVGIMLDLFLGGLDASPYGFTYSFLFLGIIYSGVRGAGLAWWFFLAQLLIALFNNQLVSPLLLLLSPLLNFAFGFTLPLLFLLSFPLLSWQLKGGLLLIQVLQTLVSWSAKLVGLLPVWEVDLIMLLMLGLFVGRKWKLIPVLLLLLSMNLNLDQQRTPSLGSFKFRPQGEKLKTIQQVDQLVIYYSDGKCKVKLVRGFWWERCSPKRSTLRKKLKKLSYPS